MVLANGITGYISRHSYHEYSSAEVLLELVAVSIWHEVD